MLLIDHRHTRASTSSRKTRRSVCTPASTWSKVQASWGIGDANTYPCWLLSTSCVLQNGKPVVCNCMVSFAWRFSETVLILAVVWSFPWQMERKSNIFIEIQLCIGTVWKILKQFLGYWIATGHLVRCEVYCGLGHRGATFHACRLCQRWFIYLYT